MLLASAMGATAFQKGLGATHSLAHPLSTLHGVHHGLANAIMLATTLAFNEDAAADRLADIAYAVGASGTTREAVAELASLVGIPQTLSEVGVAEGDVAALAEAAIQDGCHLTNPRPVTEDDMVSMYRAAL